METKINAIHFDISEKLTSFINKKIDKLTRRYPNVMSAEVSLRVVKPETALNKEAIVSLMVPQEPDQVATKQPIRLKRLSISAWKHSTASSKK